MLKKAQITIFILIAIFIISAILIFFSLRTDLIKKSLSPETEGIYLFVQECIEQEGIEIIYIIGQNGGYFFSPEFSTESRIPYYYSDGKNYMPSKKQVEKEISFFMNEKLFFCTRNFVDFPDLEITQGKIKTQTEIMDEKIVLDVTYEIAIEKGESTSIIKDFRVEIPVRLGIVYNSISKFMQDQIGQESICLSCLLDISLENDLYVDMIDYDDETTIFIFRDENSKINNETFTWIFANKYKIE